MDTITEDRDINPDPDAGLEVLPEVKQELIESLKEVGKGIPLDELRRQLGL
ncbi:MAG: hypothetical protein HQK96_19360 [Nitrospirae bacterium]|nr:hypothetical protein [Nitrospirota bacterium]